MTLKPYKYTHKFKVKLNANILKSAGSAKFNRHFDERE